MPTYEYACPTCGLIEVFQSIKEKALTKCPQCKKAKVTRIISGGAGVIFKGSGFWETDYNRSSDYQAKSKADKGDKAPETQSKTATETKKSDAKPTATPATPSSDKPTPSSTPAPTAPTPAPSKPSGGSPAGPTAP
jgi:putative FmdB family regulatory protein